MNKLKYKELNISAIAELVVTAEIQGLINLSDQTKKPEFKTLVELCRKSLRKASPMKYDNRGGKIIFSGVGKNATIATKASETFASLGVPSFFLNVCHYAHGDAGFIGDEDVVIHISRSGTTSEILQAALHLKKNRPHIKQVLVHCNKKFDIESDGFMFDQVFFAGEAIEADENNLAPTTSTTVLLALTDILAVILSSDIEFTRENFLEFHPGGALGAMLAKEQKS